MGSVSCHVNSLPWTQMTCQWKYSRPQTLHRSIIIVRNIHVTLFSVLYCHCIYDFTKYQCSFQGIYFLKYRLCVTTMLFFPKKLQGSPYGGHYFGDGAASWVIYIGLSPWTSLGCIKPQVFCHKMGFYLDVKIYSWKNVLWIVYRSRHSPQKLRPFPPGIYHKT